MDVELSDSDSDSDEEEAVGKKKSSVMVDNSFTPKQKPWECIDAVGIKLASEACFKRHPPWSTMRVDAKPIFTQKRCWRALRKSSLYAIVYYFSLNLAGVILNSAKRRRATDRRSLL